MNDSQTYTRYPAVRCWIKHLLESKYIDEDKTHFTIFGKVKRIRLIATIVEKREILNNESDDVSEFDDENSNTRIEFDLEDGTGLIRATLWRANPEDYKEFTKGDLVDITGLPRNWKGFVSISPEIIKKVDDPNFKLLLDAEIIKRIKKGDTFDLPEFEEEQIDEIPDEFDIDGLFEEDSTFEETNEDKLQILKIIKDNTSDGEGINFKAIKSQIDISEEDLRDYLQALEMESKIYESETDVFQII